MTLIISRDYAAEIDKWCRDRAGNYYGYGEAFTTNPARSTDCSGLVLQTGARWMKRTDWSGNRYGSTESFRLDYKIVYDLGFRRLPRGGVSALSFKPIMLVGLQHGGGGIYSHTACTLFHADTPGGPIKDSVRGIDWESRGGSPGVRYYNGARAWNDTLFHDFWYFDGKLAPVAPVVIINEIDAELARAKAWIGARRTDELDTAAGDGGKYSEFGGGRIYWSPRVRANMKAGDRAVAVPSHIIETYDAAGSSAGPLGYPTLRHTTIADTGDIQAFERGAIYRRFGKPGVIVHGAILDRYRAVGFEKGWGWPIGNEAPTPDGGRRQEFERVVALWHPSGVVSIEAAR